jgi:hypothetical protein
MSLRTLRSVFVAAIVIAGVMASLVIRYRAKVKLDQNAAVLQQQKDRETELAAENRRLSNPAAQAKRSSAEDQTAELLKLRTEAEALRKQANDLRTHLAEQRRLRSQQRSLRPDLARIGGISVVSDSDSEEYKEQLYKMAWGSKEHPAMRDAYNLKYAVWQYTLAHNGEFPLSLDQLAPYVYQSKGGIPLGGTLKGRDPMAGATEFDLVYQGSRQELSNVPEEAVAMLRERQAWPTPEGKSARVYVMANGHGILVESADNFQSWEAEHVIPPPTADQ